MYDIRIIEVTYDNQQDDDLVVGWLGTAETRVRKRVNNWEIVIFVHHIWRSTECKSYVIG